jgi:hypothetical protein
MAHRKKPLSSQHVTSTFEYEGQRQYAEVVDGRLVRRCRYPSKELIEEVTCDITRAGCYIEAIGVSQTGAWLVTQRISGQGEWGYDVFRTSPLARVAGVAQERGYILDLPTFAPDDSWLVGGAGKGFLGQWWAHPDDEPDEPARGGLVSLGFLFVHRLPRHKVARHDLRVKLPTGWVPEDPWGQWYGPREITPITNRIQFLPSWGVPVTVAFPPPRVIRLPVPHPSGSGLLLLPQRQAEQDAGQGRGGTKPTRGSRSPRRRAR